MGNFEEEYREQYEDEKMLFLDENKKDLMKEFIDNNMNEFNDFLKSQFIDNDRTIEYWENVFCEEIKEEEFYDYVNDSFNEVKDDEDTKRSIVNSLYAGVFLK